METKTAIPWASLGLGLGALALVAVKEVRRPLRGSPAIDAASITFKNLGTSEGVTEWAVVNDGEWIGHLSKQRPHGRYPKLGHGLVRDPEAPWQWEADVHETILNIPAGASFAQVKALVLAAAVAPRGSRAVPTPKISVLRAALRAARPPTGSADRTSVKRRTKDPLQAVADAFLGMDPREVSDTDLVAVLLAGSTDGDPLDAAASLLRDLRGNLARVGRAEGFAGRTDLRPMARARVLAAAELARRAALKGAVAGDGHPVTTPTGAIALARAYAIGPQERIVGLYFDSRFRLLASRVLHLGSTYQSIVDTREVLLPAIESRASAIILVHNHPSGEAEPSLDDNRMTSQLARAAKVLGLTLMDHLILGKEGSTYSYVERNPNLLSP